MNDNVFELNIGGYKYTCRENPKYLISFPPFEEGALSRCRLYIADYNWLLYERLDDSFLTTEYDEAQEITSLRTAKLILKITRNQDQYSNAELLEVNKIIEIKKI